MRSKRNANPNACLAPEPKLSHPRPTSTPVDPLPDDLLVGVVGTGFIGASLIGHLGEMDRPISVLALDEDYARAEIVAERHAKVSAARQLSSLADCDIVFVCTPVSFIARTVIDLSALLKPDAVIIDTGSTKAGIVAEVSKSLPGFDRFVPGHPMSGSHLSGPEASDRECFAKKPFILTPYGATATEAVDRVRALLEQSGCRVLVTSVDAHDRILGDTSHLSHLIAFAMVNQLEDEAGDPELGELIAGSFMRMTGFAASDPRLWTDVFLANDANVLSGLERFRTALDAFEGAIRDRDSDRLMSLTGHSSQKRRKMDK